MPNSRVADELSLRSSVVMEEKEEGKSVGNIIG